MFNFLLFLLLGFLIFSPSQKPQTAEDKQVQQITKDLAFHITHPLIVFDKNFQEKRVAAFKKLSDKKQPANINDDVRLASSLSEVTHLITLFIHLALLTSLIKYLYDLIRSKLKTPQNGNS